MTPELQALLDRLLNPATATGGPVRDDELAALTDADLALLRAGVVSAAQELADSERTQENVDAITRAADAVERVADLQDRREAEAAQRDQATRDALERVNARGSGTAAEDADAADEDAESVTASAASGRRAPIGAMGRRRAATSTTDRPAAPASPRDPSPLVAASSVPGRNPGDPYGDLYDVADALNQRMRTLGRGAGSHGEQVIVASGRWEYAADRRLSSTASASENTRRMGAVTDPEAVVAAGGFCAPAEVDYTVDVLGVTDRPFRDALPGFGADRGRISFRKNLAFADYTGAIGTWTGDDDVLAADPEEETPPTKPCIVVECPDLDDAAVDAVTLCMRFRNLTSRFDPEGTAAGIRAGDIAFARYAENRLMALARANAIDVTSPATGLGGWRDLLAALEHLIAYRNSRWRTSGIQIRAALPAWLTHLLALDMARGMHGGATELLAPATDLFNTWLRNRGVTPVWHLDGMAAQSASAGVPAVAAQVYGSLTDAAALPGFPAQTSILLWNEGDLSYLDGGTLDLGVIRDTASVASNSYTTFMEEFNGLAFRGQEMYHLAAALEPRGGQAATVDTSAFSD